MISLTPLWCETLPTVVISLDFEMRWGMHDKLGLNIDAYRENLENVHFVVPALLKIFKDRNIRTTWACVGALGCDCWDDYFNKAPPPPNYHNHSLAVKHEYAELDPSGSLHFAPSLIKSILTCPGQDLGTHTFSHIFMREPGITCLDVQSDLTAVFDLWNTRFGGPPVSFVFPRNQCAFEDVIKSMGIRIFRLNQDNWYHDSNELNSGNVARLLRFIDDLNPFVRRSHIYRAGYTQASLFLRFNLSDFGWNLHLKRIKNELNQLNKNSVLHLWWHPHNLGFDTTNRLKRAESVMDMIADQLAKNVAVSKNMRDLLISDLSVN